MRRTLVDPQNTRWQNLLGCLAAVVIVPASIVVKLATLPFERPIYRSAEEVARYLRDFIEGTGSHWDWDDFEHMSIADPELEAIRDRASRVREPIDSGGWATLRGLLAEAETLARRGAATSANG